MRIRVCIALVIALKVIPGFAQDGHYWTQQYGTRSMLLSGSVIGGVDDLGAVYYNPGRLAVISNTAFLLSASVYEYNSLKVSDAFGSAKNASKSTIKGVPTLAAGTFKVKFLPKHSFAYAVMTRQSSDLNVAYRDEVDQDVIATVPGNEFFGSAASFNQKSSEQWIGVTWSYPISKKVSVGVTTNFSTSSQDKSSAIDLNALAESGDVAVYHYTRSYTFKKTGLLWKAGLAADLGQWQLGLTVTTPQLNLSGKGTYTYEEFLSSMPGMTQPDRYSSSYQSGLATNYRTAFSTGIGVARKLGKNKLYFSTEWFAAVPMYTLMNAADHTSQSNPATTIRFELVDQLKSVANAGIGAEIYISDHVSGFGSFSTDYSAVTSDIARFIERQDQVNNSSWNANFYHAGGGVVLDFKGVDITLGATHTGAAQSIPRAVNFPDGSGQGIFNSGQTSTLQWERWRLVFSFSFPFLKDYASKFTEKPK